MESIDFSDFKSQMSDALAIFQKKLAGLRAGRASPALLEPITVDVYGGRMPLNQLGNISAPEPRLLIVQVWDNQAVGAVEKAIISFGLTPVTEGTVLRIRLPELSQERRKELSKIAKTYAEETRIGLRNIRRQFLDNLDKDSLPEDELHLLKKEVQKITDDFIEKTNSLLSEKEIEIMKI
jgi:ribosome recycling factor